MRRLVAIWLLMLAAGAGCAGGDADSQTTAEEATHGSEPTVEAGAMGEVEQMTSSADEPPMLQVADVVLAVGCHSVVEEVQHRTRIGTIDRASVSPADVDDDEIVIDYLEVDDTVALTGERPTSATFPAADDVQVSEMQSEDLLVMVRECRRRAEIDG
jgi:hypothetical protein